MTPADLQGCFFHWLASPARRRLLGARHLGAQRLGAYLFLPFRLGPSPGWNDLCLKEAPRVTRLVRLPPQILDFVGDLRLVEEDGSRNRLFASMPRLMELLTRAGVRLQTHGGELGWPTQSIPWIGFVANAREGVFEIEARKRRKGMSSRDAIMGILARLLLSARPVRAAASFLNFFQRMAAGVFFSPPRQFRGNSADSRLSVMDNGK